MSTFNGRLKELENVLIDNFLEYKSNTCFFLSHCHSDHMNGLDELLSNIKDSNYQIYCSPISRLILLNKYKLGSDNAIRELTSTEVLTVPGNDCAPSYQVTVTPIPAGHCPGSIMFLFESGKKTIVYTGDFRISTDDFTKFKPFHTNNQVKVINKLYFDSTFLNEIYWNFPLRSEVVDELLNIIQSWLSKSSDHNVLLETSASYGYEFIFSEIARKLKCKIHVKNTFYHLFWNVPDIGIFLTKNCSSTRLHAFGMFDVKCLPCSKEKLLKIRMSAQWYKSSKDGSKPSVYQQVSNRRIIFCYSTHCSCSELYNFINYLKPKSLECCTTAVGSTKEEMNSLIEHLMFSWEIQKKLESIEESKINFKLEKNYKFNLKLPIQRSTNFEVPPEKKQKEVEEVKVPKLDFQYKKKCVDIR